MHELFSFLTQRFASSALASVKAKVLWKHMETYGVTCRLVGRSCGEIAWWIEWMHGIALIS